MLLVWPKATQEESRLSVPPATVMQYEMQHEKEKVPKIRDLLSAEDGSRTHKVLLPHGPEPCASANSATSARTIRIITHFYAPVNTFFKKILLRKDAREKARQRIDDRAGRPSDRGRNTMGLKNTFLSAMFTASAGPVVQAVYFTRAFSIAISMAPSTAWEVYRVSME